MTEEAFFPRRPLGKTGLEVTPLCIGCAPLGNMAETFGYAVNEEQALATIRTIFAGPINFLDTAASYGDGESERRLGIVLRELGGLPQGFVLASKADRDLDTGEFSGEQMRRSVERSLRLLGLEQLQLLYLHDPEHISFEQAMAPGGPVETLQRCQHQGVAAINAAPYGSGMLAKGPSAYPRYMYSDASMELLERAHKLETICSSYGVPLAAAALQFSLRDPRITSTIVGMSRPERLIETITLAQYALPAELWTKLAEV